LADDVLGLPITQLNNFTWRVNTTRRHEVHVRYSVNYTINRGIYAYIGSDYAVVDEAALLLHPSPTDRTGFYRVEMEQPSTWMFVSVGAAEQGQILESPIAELGTHIFAFGSFLVSTVSLGTATLKLALLASVVGESRTYEKLVCDLYDQFEDTIGKLRKPTVLVIIAPKALPIVGFCQGASLYVDSTADPSAISHELFHLWNGVAMYPASNDGIWFREGVTEYYAKVALFRLGINGLESRLDPFLYAFRGYNATIGTPYDVSLALAWGRYVDTGDWSFRNVVYEKGQLIAYLINRTISEKTEGDKNLDDLMRCMYQAFAHPQTASRRWFKLDDIKELLTHLTNSSWQDFFNKYILGSTALPIPEVEARARYVSSLPWRIEDLRSKVDSLSASSVFRWPVLSFLDSARNETTEASKDFFRHRYRQAEEHMSKASALVESAQWIERGMWVLIALALFLGFCLLWKRRRQVVRIYS